MAPNNNYFVIIIRSFSASHASFQKIQIFSPSSYQLLFAFHRIHDFTNYLHNIDMYLFCMGAIHRGYL